ncbi:MAG: metallophosphoesterase [Acidobacteriota bacterium]|nr:metallophosphoesterase [Acidobacteriota bacterium]
MATTRKSPAKTTHKPAKKTTAKSATKKAAPKKSAHTTGISTPSQQPARGIAAGTPVFAEPRPTPDPTKYTVPHASDTAAYGEMDALIKASKFLPLPFPAVTGVVEPVLTLSDALGASGPSTVAAIEAAGQIVFQSAGDTGATRGPKTENETVDKMLADFTGEAPAAVPQFFYNLGDIVYSFGEHKYYYDQFYAAYRDYPRPIFAIPGNHDGIVLPPPAGTGDASASLAAYLANFCAPAFAHSTDAVGIARTTMIQPGVYFTLEAPLVRILGLYSNMLENPGVLSSTKNPTTGKPAFPQLSDVQLEYLTAALTRIKKENFAGAVLIAVHHPPYTFGTHSGSPTMLKEIDACCIASGVWPHAILSGHAHNYQRYTRELPVGKTTRQIPFLVVGNGGHGLRPLSIAGVTLRTPQPMAIFAQPERNDTVTFVSYDDQHYGYVRVLVTATQLRIEYHPASDGSTTKTPDDAVTIDLATGTLAIYAP